MTYQNQVAEYRKHAVSTASPLQLVIMLYDGALRFLEQGRRAMRAGETFKQNEALQRCQRIIGELTACLDLERGGEIAANLFSLYSFAYDEVVAANLADDPAKLDAVENLLTDLRASWSELEAQHKAGSAQHAA